MRRLLSILLIFLFIPLALVVSVGYVANKTVLASNFVKDGLVQSGVYEAIFDPQLIPELVNRIQENQEDAAMPSDTLGEESFDIDPALLTTAATRVQQALKDEFGPTYIQSKVEPLIDSFYAWMLGDTDKLQLVMAVDSDLADRIVTVFKNTTAETLRDIPTCASEEEFMQQTSITCFPPGAPDELIDQFITEFSGQFDETIRTIIPEQIDYAPALMQSDSYSNLLLVRAVIQMVRQLLQWLVVSLVVIIGLLVFLNREVVYTRWVGVSLILGFLVPVALSIALASVGEKAYTDVIVSQIAGSGEIPVVLQNIASNLGYYIMHAIGTALETVAIAPFVLGLLATFIPKRMVPIMKTTMPKAPDIAQ